MLSRQDMIDINITIKSLSENLKTMCENISKKNPKFNATYSEKDKKCILKSSTLLNDLITNMDIKKVEDNETHILRNNFLKDVEPVRHLIILNEHQNHFPHQNNINPSVVR